MAKSVYDETYQRSMKDPAAFWAAAAEDIHWDSAGDRVFDDSRKPFSRWFEEARSTPATTRSTFMLTAAAASSGRWSMTAPSPAR